MRLFSRSLFLLIFSIACFAFAVPTLRAQNTDPQNDTGLHAYETYDGARENINLGTGNVFLSIPLLTLRGRNGHNYSVSLMSNSQSWSPSSGWVNGNLGMVLSRTGDIYLHPGGVVWPTSSVWCVSNYVLSDEMARNRRRSWFSRNGGDLCSAKTTIDQPILASFWFLHYLPVPSRLQSRQCRTK